MAEKTPTRPDREPDVRIDVPAGVKIKQSELERIREFSRENHPGQSGKPLPKPMPGTPSDGQ